MVETSELNPDLINYWAEHGPKLQEQHPGKYLVLSVKTPGLPVRVGVYASRDRALNRVVALNVRGLYISLP